MNLALSHLHSFEVSGSEAATNLSSSVCLSQLISNRRRGIRENNQATASQKSRRTQAKISRGAVFPCQLSRYEEHNF